MPALVPRAAAERPGPRASGRPVPAGRLRALRLTGTCCGIDYPRLAEGEADVAVFWSPRLWDHAPGSLLLHETGGVVAGLRGQYQVRDRRPRLLVAAGDRSAYEAVRVRRV